jgi:hypothetical protein
MTKRVSPRAMTDDQIVARFIVIGEQQDECILANEISRVSKLFREKTSLVDELKSRPGDHRRLLLDLHNHPNRQVRLNAAKATLAVAPAEARAVLEALTVNKFYYQALDAGMCLWALDEGIFKPT